MTEAEWLSCPDPLRLIKALPSPSFRKSGLFACACCHRLWPKLTDPRSRRVVEAAERYLEDAAARDELVEATGPASAVMGFRVFSSHLGGNVFDYSPIEVAKCCLAIAEHNHNVAEHSGHIASCSEDIPAEWGHQSSLVRCVFGNPFRHVALDPIWVTSTARGLAEGIYAERAYDRMPILADALEDAGCDDADVLAHCRGDGPHVRGCWVVDLLLGRG